MAHTKAQRAVRGNRDSRSKRMGVKLYGCQPVTRGSIIVRQRGSKFYAGEGAFIANDFTIHASRDGIVKFFKMRGKQYISVDLVGTPSRIAKVRGQKTAEPKVEKKPAAKKAASPAAATA